MKPIGILGGTFDPVHYGHLRLALELYQQLDLQAVRFVPCQQPVLAKVTHTPPAQRLAMLQLAVSHQPEFSIDDRELIRKTPSYMIETLSSLRQEFPKTPLVLIIGSDAFAQLNRWHRWQELLTLAHLIVVARPDTAWPNPEWATDLLQQHQTHDFKSLHQQLAGNILIPQITPLAISSTAIRAQIAAQLNPQYLLPDEVLAYIQQEQLYCA